MGNTFVGMRLRTLPTPLSGPNGQASAHALGSAQDDELAMLSVVGKLRSPVRIDSTAIDDVGVGYQIPRYASQSDAAYQAAIIAAWQTWAEAGSPQAIIDQLHAYGVSDVRVVQEETNHGATAARATSTTYNPGALIKANDAGGSPQVLEMVSSSSASSGSGAFTATMGQAQADGTATWAWRCAAAQDANDPGYDEWWYSRFDVVLGGQTAGNFGTLAVNKFVLNNAIAVTSGSVTVPAVNGTVSVAVSSGSLTIGAVVYIARAGYYLVVSGSGPYVVQNLGDAAAAYAVWWASNHTAGQVFAPDVWGAPGQFPNLAPGLTFGNQPIVAAGSGILGQTRLGIAIVDDSARQDVKSIILRWKATHGYAGRIVLAYDGAQLDPFATPGFHNGLTYIGKMLGINYWLGFSMIGGYDRS
jgi:hypothetical protein